MACSTTVPKWNLNNGQQMPALALGTYLGFDQNGMIKSTDKQLRDVVLQALDAGYRHFDTASVYNTEEEIGEAVQMKIADGKIARDDVFITTKLWNTQHRKDQVVPALRESLERLGMKYVDLYLMHWPIALNENNTEIDIDFMETWRGMEEAVHLGLAKSIGLSNFNKEQLQRVIREGNIKPAALEIEVHLQIVQSELVSYAQSQGLIVMGYSPFGSLVMRFGMTFPGPKIDDPTLVKIAQKYGKTTPQVVLRWLVDRKIVPIAKTVNPKRLIENINIFDFQLEKQEIEEMNSFNEGIRYTLPSFWQNHPNYPFEKVTNPIMNPFIKKNIDNQ